MKSNFLFSLVSTILFMVNGYTQKKQEQEFRIDKEGLPENVLPILSEYLNNVKRLRFYKELDGEKSSYEVKFKKDKLFYSVEFDGKGRLEDVEFIITENDIPEETLNTIEAYLYKTHTKFRIKKIQQQYLNNGSDVKAILKMAFQNLISTDVNYEIIIATKEEEGYVEYEITFNANGKHLLTRKSIAPNYDHVLFH